MVDSVLPFEGFQGEVAQRRIAAAIGQRRPRLFWDLAHLAPEAHLALLRRHPIVAPALIEVGLLEP